MASTNPKLKIRASASEIDLSIFHSKEASMKKCTGCLNCKSQLQHIPSKATVASTRRPYCLPRVSHLESLDRHGSSTLEPKCIPTSTRVKMLPCRDGTERCKKCGKASCSNCPNIPGKEQWIRLRPIPITLQRRLHIRAIEGMSQC